ncbi:MAG: hypothetical protein IKE75_00650 [Bacilli bacterium]|nr:hypothetical protein [Bacilli bacterium]
MNYTHEYLEKEIMKKVSIDKTTSNFFITVCGENIDTYPLDFNQKNVKIVNDVENSFLTFFSIFTENENFDLNNFRNNLNKNLVIAVDMNGKNKDSGTTVYNDTKNLFGIYADSTLIERGVIFHELFHFASHPTNFKRGLNEGYTEALTHRYFNKTKLAYPDNVYYAIELEKIIGKDIMEKAYSCGNINIVKDYIGEENSYTFEKINTRLDLLLGSYYRVNNNKALEDEQKRVLKAKEELNQYLELLQKNIVSVNKRSK